MFRGCGSFRSEAWWLVHTGPGGSHRVLSRLIRPRSPARHPAPGPGNHGDVTLPLFQPPRCHIAVVSRAVQRARAGTRAHHGHPAPHQGVLTGGSGQGSRAWPGVRGQGSRTCQDTGAGWGPRTGRSPS